MGSAMMEGLVPTSSRCSPLLSVLLMLLQLTTVTATIFGAPRSFCGQDSDCPTFGRTRCVGPSLGFCLSGKSQYSTIPGKCVRRGNITCRLKVLLEMGDQAQCDYYTCAQCRHTIDCTGLNQMCAGFRCSQRGGHQFLRF